jgi:hypothetical protein
MTELTESHYRMLSHFIENGGSLTYESIVDKPPIGSYWNKHEVASILRELCDSSLLKRGELTVHTITEKGKIANVIPHVYRFLSSKNLEDIFYWKELKQKANVSDDIDDILKSKLYQDNHIKTSSIRGSEEDGNFFEVTQKFKLFYSGLENKEPVPVNITGNTGNVFYHSPVSESIIETAVAPTVMPKKKTKISKAIIIISAIVAAIAGLVAIYEFILKKWFQ